MTTATELRPIIKGDLVLFNPDDRIFIGPTWRKDSAGWVLPERTLGWEILKWIEDYLKGDDGEPFRPTAEQARFLLWWYAIDERGLFVYRAGILQRLKGWGKDPLAAVLAAVEFLGPCRFGGWMTEDDPERDLQAGDPFGREHLRAWVQIVAVSQKQTKNTMLLMSGVIGPELRALHGMTKADFGKEVIYAYGGNRQIETVTSSPRALEGNRPTFIIQNETHHWVANNEGLSMYEAIDRNAAKSKDGAARTLSITNAYDPAEESVAQKQREAWEDVQAGLNIDTGVLYDSIEAPKSTPLLPPGLEEPSDEQVKAWIESVVTAIRGDAVWLSAERITQSVLDGSLKPSLSRRFYFNTIVNAEDAWVDADAVDAAIDPMARDARALDSDELRAGWLAMPDEPCVLFFDGSLSDDATGLVVCRLSDGYGMTGGIWQKPPAARGPAAKGWRAPRHEVTARVDELFERFNIVAFWGDPSHTMDEDGTRYWDSTIDGWHQRYKDRLQLWSIKTGDRQHAIMWDMASPERTRMFTEAAMQFTEELEHREVVDGPYRPLVSFDGHPALVKHLKNARRTGNKYGITLWKGGRESPNKIDLAVCFVGARMLRRALLNRGLELVEEPAGEIWGA